MPRKSMAKQRREELLDAFERCIIKYGLEGTSLEQVADEAQMTRSIIRHYIGNRDDLVSALIDRLIRQYAEQLTENYADIPPEQMVSYAVDNMFSQKDALSVREKIIIDVLMTAKERYPDAKKKLIQMYDAVIQSFASDLERQYPNATQAQCWQIAYAVVCISEMNETFMWLGMNPRYHADARQVAENLLASLNS
ncbi:MAG: TetR family transcriptional regulator [Chloroflexota bacterium]